MTRRSDRAARNEFEHIRKGFARLVKQLGLQIARRDLTMFVDTACLYDRCGVIRRFIRDLVSTNPRRVEAKIVTHRAGRLWAEVDNLDAYSRDLRGPLDRLHSKLVRRAPYFAAEPRSPKASNHRMQATAGELGGARRSRRASARRA